MTAGDTLLFAARARAPANRLPGVSREQYAVHMRDVVMAILGLSHTKNTRVGNEYIRGVSGGERKRVSIAETTLCGSPLQCWDNSTRGLDSATALEFVRTLRTSTKYSGSTAIVAIYQAGQAIYDVCIYGNLFESSDANCHRYLTKPLFCTKVARFISVAPTMPNVSSLTWASTAHHDRPPPIS
jgi:hypothetical protein